MRSLLAIGVFFTLSLGLVMSAEFGAVINKVDGDKITVTKRGKKGDKGEEVTLSAASAKVLKGKFNPETKKLEAGDPLDGGLKNDAVKAGAFAVFVTDADNKVTEIRIGAGRKKKE